jgi:UDP-N-acetylglucosamine 2-epimerase
VAHVEAGLRSFNRAMSEEINRLLTDHLSTFLFCPTDEAVKNLSREGIKDGKTKVVKKVGDVMYDSILYYSEIAQKKSKILEDLGFPNQQSAIGNLQYYLVTLHRAENTDDPRRLKSILRALNEIGKDMPIIFPLHPRTKKVIKTYHLIPETRNIRLIEPASYLDMLVLERNARAILTDSGGVQKEAYWFKVPCFTLRDETEWVETVKSGWNILVKPGEKKIVETVRNLKAMKRLSGQKGIFEDGKASERIIRIMAGCF